VDLMAKLKNRRWGWERTYGAGDEAEKVPKVQVTRLRRYLRCRRRGWEGTYGAGDKAEKVPMVQEMRLRT